MGIGDWGLGIGIGDWGLGPIPNPQSPIPNPQSPFFIYILDNYNKNIYLILSKLINYIYLFNLLFHIKFNYSKNELKIIFFFPYFPNYNNNWNSEN